MNMLEGLKKELEELYQEYDRHYETSRDIMQQIDMVESDIEKIEKAQP